MTSQIDVPAEVWSQLCLAERGYLLLTHIGRIPLSAMCVARDRQNEGNSPDLARTEAGLRQMLPVVEASSKDGTSFAAMDATRAAAIREVLEAIEKLPQQFNEAAE